MINIRKELLQHMYELMSNERGVHDEVDEKFENATNLACKDIDEKSDKYDEIMRATCELEKTAFFAGANMVLDFTAGQERNEKVMKYDLYEISAEINAISMIVSGLSNQIGEDRDSLQDEPLKNALFGVSRHLGRVGESLDEIDAAIAKKGR